MNYKEIFTPQEMRDFKLLIKSKKATHADIKLYAKFVLTAVYNGILTALNCMNSLDFSAIYNRDSMACILADLESDYSNVKAIFTALVGSGYIGVCGRGYTLEMPRQSLTSDESDRLAEIVIAMAEV